jgi:hypothetical protein
MNDDQHSEPDAQSQQDESVFIGRVLRVIKQSATFVQEDGLRLRKRDAVPSGVGRGFGRVPSERHVGHDLEPVCTMYLHRASRSGLPNVPNEPRARSDMIALAIWARRLHLGVRRTPRACCQDHRRQPVGANEAEPSG